MFTARHYVTGNFEKRRIFLPDREYGLALDALVKGCADVLVTRQSGEIQTLEILLGRRKVEPQPDWWFVGGRTRPGDSPFEGAARNVGRELGLKLGPERFKVVGTYSFVWRMRQQEPQTNGTADISTVFELALTTDESKGLKFDENEYRDAQWLRPGDILSSCDFHPALQQAVRDLLTRRAFLDLRNAFQLPAFILAARARRLIAWHDSAVTTDDVKVLYESEHYNFRDPSTDKPIPRALKPVPAPAHLDLAAVNGHHPTKLVSRLGDPRVLIDLLAGPLLGAALGILLYRRSTL